MSRVDGLIIPRSYNDYYSKSDPTAMREVIAQNTDSSLSSVSEMPVQNKVVKSALDAAAPVDSVADGEMKPPTSNAVYDAISAEHESNAPIMASTTTISGPALATNGSVLIMFTDNIAGTDGTTPLALTYNGTSIPVKAHSGGSLVDVTAKEIAASAFRYLDKYTSLQMVFDGTNFVIVGNPVVLSGTDYTIYADGYNDKEYARKQNILSDYEIVTLPFTAAYDGIFSFYYHPTDSPSYLYVNVNDGTYTFPYYTGGTVYDQSVEITIRKGDVLSLVTKENTSNERYRVRYYKQRDYSGR